MKRSTAKSKRTAPLRTPTGLGANATRDIAAALTTLLAIAAGALGDREAATAALSRIPPGWDAEQYVRHHGGTEEIVAAVAKGIETARRIADIPARP